MGGGGGAKGEQGPASVWAQARACLPEGWLAWPGWAGQGPSVREPQQPGEDSTLATEASALNGRQDACWQHPYQPASGKSGRSARKPTFAGRWEIVRHPPSMQSFLVA